MGYHTILKAIFRGCYSIDFETTNNIDLLKKINSYAKIYH